jgi:Large polyvalent protein associated domain 29
MNAAQSIKKHLRETFGIKARVSSSSYSGGSSIRIAYVGGPNTDIVEKSLTGLEYGSFDGMQDLYEYSKAPGLVLFGQPVQQFKYSFVNREIPSSFWLTIAVEMSKHIRFADIHPCESIADFEKSFPKLFAGSWEWSNLVYKMFRNMHLVTSDFDGIEILDFFSHSAWEYGFIYSYNGKAYSTLDGPIADQLFCV